jgi:hypothetical protein
MVSLCPSCLSMLTPGIYRCERCGVAFKDEKTMVRRSLLIPGGGYFYTGHWFLGLGDFLAEAYLLILLIVFLAAALAPTPASPGQESLTSREVWIAAGIIAAILSLEKWLTIHHCRRFIREFIPLGHGEPPQRLAA